MGPDKREGGRMSYSDLIQSMADAGAPMEAILIAVRAIEAKEQEQADKRRKAAERKQRERDNKRDSHATVTGQSQQKEKNQKKKNPPSDIPLKGDISSVPPSGTKKRASRIPDDWEPDREYAAGKGLSSQQIDIEAEKFRNYWGSAPPAKATKTDWRKTWFNWVIAAVERGQPRQGRPPPNIPTTEIMTEAVRKRYQELKAIEDAEEQSSFTPSKAGSDNGFTIEGRAG